MHLGPSQTKLEEQLKLSTIAEYDDENVRDVVTHLSYATDIEYVLDRESQVGSRPLPKLLVPDWDAYTLLRIIELFSDTKLYFVGGRVCLVGSAYQSEAALLKDLKDAVGHTRFEYIVAPKSTDTTTPPSTK